MQAKTIARTGTRFFAHDRAETNCWLNGETALHRRLKADIADLVRGRGGSAEVEAAPAEGDVGEWRADVLARAPDGRRIAFEVQLATMTIDEGRERQARYALDRIETFWLTTRQPPWLWELPGVRLIETTADAAFVVSAGLAKLIEDRWRCPPEPVALEKVIAGVLAGSIEHCDVGWLSEARNSHPWALVPSVHARRHEALVRAQAAAETQRKADEERHAQHMERLYARQAYLLPIAVVAARTVAREDQRVWLGVPPTPYVEDPGRGVDLLDAVGNETTAFGSVVWLGGRHREGLSLFAVLSPVASRIAPSLADSWRRRGVQVFVAEDREAERVARALGRWPATWLRLHRSDRELTNLDPELGERIAARQRAVAFRQIARAFVGLGY